MHNCVFECEEKAPTKIVQQDAKIKELINNVKELKASIKSIKTHIRNLDLYGRTDVYQ
jgi:peptidoglycan hydrolase CwlO-like protein